MNPYKILGVPEGADAETIKKAYHELVKKYHPDQYANNPLSELAAEKMKEINQAYDMLTHHVGGADFNGDSGSSYNGNSEFANIRRLIQNGRLAEAEVQLAMVKNQNAEWHFLKGIVALNKGFYDQAIEHLNRAVELDPSNAEYRGALNNIAQRNQGYRNMGNAGGFGQSNSCDCCTSLLCADCCCQCMGGGC